MDGLGGWIGINIGIGIEIGIMTDMHKIWKQINFQTHPAYELPLN